MKHISWIFQHKRVRLNQNTFVNPYTTRFNNGIPMYSQERIEERTKKVWKPLDLLRTVFAFLFKVQTCSFVISLL